MQISCSLGVLVILAPHDINQALPVLSPQHRFVHGCQQALLTEHHKAEDWKCRTTDKLPRVHGQKMLCGANNNQVQLQFVR